MKLDPKMIVSSLGLHACRARDVAPPLKILAQHGRERIGSFADWDEIRGCGGCPKLMPN